MRLVQIFTNQSYSLVYHDGDGNEIDLISVCQANAIKEVELHIYKVWTDK